MAGRVGSASPAFLCLASSVGLAGKRGEDPLFRAPALLVFAEDDEVAGYAGNRWSAASQHQPDQIRPAELVVA